MRIRSLHPGVTHETVRKATGFELIVDGEPRTTSMPTAEELALLRERVDATGILREKAS